MYQIGSKIKETVHVHRRRTWVYVKAPRGAFP